ncbi:hypothetical protein O3M35_010432 [Rhynocoris fuscipes]|uniref:Very-long-chain (3R)-3-hydroxyacyl-CoA dehydratase n=1 Tax=Rhynocoris fuscipes TaxID=488301 RepID=A0AAW1CYU6_9HEMI
MAGKSSNKENKTESFGAVKVYLLVYNALQVVGWSYLLYQTINHFLSGNDITTLWNEVKPTVVIFQNAALLEILNVALGFVRSNLGMTFFQVMSRVMVVCGVLLATPTATVSYGLPMLLFAWSVTEIIRYSFYALSLLNAVPYLLVWCRYTFFYALYPIGVSGELLCFYAAQSFVSESKQWSIALPNSVNFTFDYHYLLLGVMASYIPLFPQLYFYMIGQRKKIIGGNSQQDKKRK